MTRKIEADIMLNEHGNDHGSVVWLRRIFFLLIAVLLGFSFRYVYADRVFNLFQRDQKQVVVGASTMTIKQAEIITALSEQTATLQQIEAGVDQQRRDVHLLITLIQEHTAKDKDKAEALHGR